MTEHEGRGYACQAARLDRYWSDWHSAAGAGIELPMLVTQTLRTQYRVGDFVSWQREGTLKLNPDFQRRAVWRKGAKSYLIDTIVRGLPVPLIFLRDLRADLRTYKTARDVVDGQQRIRTILGFIDPSLLPDYDNARDDFAIDRVHNKDLGGKRFHQLSKSIREHILDYQFSVHSFPADTDDRELLQIFARLNSTGLRLNPQELRNAEFYGAFKTTAYELATEQLNRWRDWEVFNREQIARMNEVELTSEFMIFMMNGTLQRDQKTIDKFYHEYDSEFSDRHEVERRYRLIFDTLEDLFMNDNHLLFSTRTLFFAVFIAAYGMQFEMRTPPTGRRHPSPPPLSKDKAASFTPEMRGRLLAGGIAIRDKTAPEAILNSLRGATTDPGARRALIDYLSGKEDAPAAR